MINSTQMVTLIVMNFPLMSALITMGAFSSITRPLHDFMHQVIFVGRGECTMNALGLYPHGRANMLAATLSSSRPIRTSRACWACVLAVYCFSFRSCMRVNITPVLWFIGSCLWVLPQMTKQDSGL